MACDKINNSTGDSKQNNAETFYGLLWTSDYGSCLGS